MIVRPVTYQEKKAFDAVVNHPIQSWAWGEFRVSTGLQVIRLGIYEEATIVQGATLTVHPLPVKIPGLQNRSILYFPRGILPNELMLTAIKQHAAMAGAIYVKMEPDIAKPAEEAWSDEGGMIQNFLNNQEIAKGRPMFTQFNFWLDLAKSEDQLMAQMEPKTRYNTRLAMKKGVEVMIDNSDEAFERYLQLTEETTRRQGFYAHSQAYHRLMWKYLREAEIAHLLCAKFQGTILSTWILFTWKDRLYYPYGASTREHKDLMANNLMMWEAIRFGKRKGLQIFDMWGTAGKEPKPEDDWYGFHKFKQGYKPQLMEYLGTYDLILDQPFYWVSQRADAVRRQLLNLKAYVSR